MAVQFILGRAGSGKTHACIEAIAAELAEGDPSRLLLLIVPEQAAFQMERMLALRAPARGFSRVAVLSFSRLAARVLEATGAESAVLSPEGRQLALRAIVTREAGGLRALREAARTPGFFGHLSEFVEHLLRENVDAESLQSAASRIESRGARLKVTEVALLYKRYRGWLEGPRIDPAARLETLRRKLDRMSWIDNALVWVDGFAGFTRQELETLAALATRAHTVSITLLLDPASPEFRDSARAPDPLRLFGRTELTYRQLRAVFADRGVTVLPDHTLAAPPHRFRRAPVLAQLEASFGDDVDAGASAAGALQAAAEAPQSEEIQILELPTHRDELRAAARWIRERVILGEGAVRFRDFAVVARDLEPFSEMVADVFGEYGIPHFLDRRRPMRSHPLSRTLQAVFEVVTSDFSASAVTRLLRTGLLPIPRGEAEALENLVLSLGMRGQRAWRALADRGATGGGSPAADACQEGGATRADHHLRAAHRLDLCNRLAPLLELAAGPTMELWASVRTGSAWAARVWETLERLDVRSQLEAWIAAARSAGRWEAAETHRLAWDATCELLAQMHVLLADVPLTTEEVAGVIESALADRTLGLAPPTLDQVLVSSIERSRHPEIRFVWLFGFNEGVFPARPRDDRLLSGHEREALRSAGVDAVGSQQDEAFAERLLAYIAFTRPSQALRISFAAVAADGQELLPSRLLSEVQQAVPAAHAKRPQRDPPPVCLSEFARLYLDKLRPDRDGRPAAPPAMARLRSRLEEDPGTRRRLDFLLRGTRYKNSPAALPPAPHDPADGSAWRGSQSQVETFIQCPFKQFAQYRLRVRARRGPPPLDWDLGTAAHVLLAEVTRAAIAEEPDVGRIPDERWAALVETAIAQFQGQQPSELEHFRPDARFQLEFLGDFVREIVAVQRDRWRRGRFRPILVESEFGGDEASAWPALDIPLPGGRRIQLAGKIDRIDVCDCGDHRLVIIYDYKSKLEKLAGVRHLTGKALQAFTYLLAVRGAWENKQLAPAGVLLSPLWPDLKVVENRYVLEADADEQRMYMYRPRGVLTYEAAHALDGEAGRTHSPVAQLRVKQDGEFDSHSDACTGAHLRARLDLTRQTLRLAGEGLVAGSIDVSPLREQRTLACHRCDFGDLCRFERGTNPIRIVETALPALPPEETRAGPCDEEET